MAEEEAGEEEEGVGVAAMKRGAGERLAAVDKGCEEAELTRRRTLVLGCEATGVGGGGGVEEDMVESWLMDGDAVVDVMQLLDERGGGPAEVPVQWSTIADTASGGGCASTSRVRFIADPYASPLIFQSSCSYITINGNEESCGSSFSDWESSVMASVDTGGRMMLNVRGLGGGSNAEDQGYHKTDCSGARGANKLEARAITAAEGEKAGGAVGGGIWGMGLTDCCRDGLGWEWDDLARFLDDDVLEY